MTNLSEMLGTITDFLKTEAKTETIIGQEFKLGEFTCVPVMSVGLGLAAGGGEGKGNAQNRGQGEGTGAGGGAGMGISPVGFLATRGSEIQFIPARANRGLGAAFEKIPDLIDKYMDRKKSTTVQE